MGNQGGQISAVSWALAGLSSALVFARLYTRIWLISRPGWDDVFIVFSLLSALVCSALVEVGIGYGLGRHLIDIEDPSDRINAFKYTVIAPNFSIVSTTTGKISIVIFLMRLMGQAATQPRKWFLYILTVLSIILNVMCIVVLMGFCIPAERIWNQSVPGKCMSLQLQLVIGLIQASYNAFTDLALAIFPAFIYWTVQLPIKMKIGVLSVMSAGVFAAAATIVKCVLLKNLPDQQDITWAWAPITLWYSAEMYIIIICATLPTLRQFYLAILGRRYLDSSSGGNSGAYPNSHQRSSSIKLASRNTGGDRRRSRLSKPDDMLYTQDDSSSQHQILEANEIRKTTEVHVYESDVSESTASARRGMPPQVRSGSAV
ncbi:hypothetical protein AJ80_01212 [Polytolypa hystricis UAMH7299]|uniref:Rhodopsin domain-containing protein n=1 Tax=Polytolypa hystricis (strain UAMH7299) TaxID=1447883 RepID=A0A2B7Z2G2_POLH7|nr:hypothetical protein AJ80_01212 [Polytolypa hystricis UAMH7299]